MLEKFKKIIETNDIVVLSTVGEEKQPRSIFVEVNEIDGDKIIITDNQMQISKNNFLSNPNVCVLATLPDYSKGMRIQGTAKYYESGEYFDRIKDLETNKDWTPKGVVVISIEHIEEFS